MSTSTKSALDTVIDGVGACVALSALDVTSTSLPWAIPSGDGFGASTWVLPTGPLSEVRTLPIRSPACCEQVL